MLSDDGFEGDARVAHLHFAGAEYDAQQNLVKQHPDSIPDIMFSMFSIFSIEMRQVTHKIYISSIEMRNARYLE